MGVLIMSSVFDLKNKEIPAPTLVMAAFISAISAGIQLSHNKSACPDILLSLLPGVVMIAAAFLSREGIGYGDGLMALSIGPSLGFEIMLIGTLAAFFLSSIISIALMGFKKAGRKTKIPFVPFITVGMGVALIATV